MYNHCAIEMEQAEVARNVEDPVWMNREGQVCKLDEAFGCKVTHEIIRPDMCICDDEVGGNICMAGD